MCADRARYESFKLGVPALGIEGDSSSALSKAGQGSAVSPGRGRGTAPAFISAAMLARIKVKLSLTAVGLILAISLRLQAMDRWSALSQLESGDDDCAVGAAGEISRYQIKPEVWRRHAPTDADWTKQDDALSVARQAMLERCATFERAFHRPPTDSEFYILWNAPALVQQPSKAVLGRAERFCNLVNAPAAAHIPLADAVTPASAPFPVAPAAADCKTASTTAPAPQGSSSSRPSEGR
jgi:hypothetical protein